MLSLAQSSILLKQAPKVFSRMFEQLMLGCFISQGELSRKAIAIHNALKRDGTLKKGNSLGSMAQPTISYVIDGTQRPGQGQLLLWLEVIRQWCNDSPEMLAKIAKIGVPKPRYPREVEQDLYRLALYGTIDEIYEAYEYWKDYSLLEYLEETRHMRVEQLEFPDTDKMQSYPLRKAELQN